MDGWKEDVEILKQFSGPESRFPNLARHDRLPNQASSFTHQRKFDVGGEKLCHEYRTNFNPSPTQPSNSGCLRLLERLEHVTWNPDNQIGERDRCHPSPDLCIDLLYQVEAAPGEIHMTSVYAGHVHPG